MRDNGRSLRGSRQQTAVQGHEPMESKVIHVIQSIAVPSIRSSMYGAVDAVVVDQTPCRKVQEVVIGSWIVGLINPFIGLCSSSVCSLSRHGQTVRGPSALEITSGWLRELLRVILRGLAQSGAHWAVSYPSPKTHYNHLPSTSVVDRFL